MNEEKILLQGLRNGDESAFRQIYTAYYSVLYLHVCNKLNDREAAKDIVHDLFANLWQKRDSLIITRKLSSYLYASVRNRTLDYLAKEQSKSKYMEYLAPSFEAKVEAADYRIREKMLEQQIETALLKLPPRVREIFDLSRRQHLSHKEISQKLDISEQSVRSYIKDALRVLRVKLNVVTWINLLWYFYFF